MSHLSHRNVLAAHLAHFWGTPSGPEAREALAWLTELEGVLQRCPLAVRDAMPAHADSLAVMTEALSDLRGDVIGFYRRKGEER